VDTRTRIKRYLSRSIPQELGDDDDIFDMGLVNSLFAIELVLFVENEFSITAERDDLEIDNFSSIAALTRFVLDKQGSTGELGRGHPAD
jgi:methoxymalonate biosynthesis acyl carrier protein